MSGLSSKKRIYIFFKSIGDFCFSFFSITLLIPCFFVLFFVVLFDTKGFPIFRQLRIGKNNKTFLILKFRTMNVKTPKDVPTHLLKNPDQYITKVGKFLRKTSLDELPQLFNVFIGQMSIIGPRPALWNQTDLIELRKTNGSSCLRPGITGWAQINGRDNISIKEKAELDEYYLNSISLFMDLKIFFVTFGRVLTKKDVIEGKQS